MQEQKQKPTQPQGKKVTPQKRPAPSPQKKKPRLSRQERNGAKKLGVVLAIAFLIYLVLGLIIAMMVWYSFSTPAKNETLYAVRFYNEGVEKAVITHSAGDSNNSYGLYVRYSDLTSLCSFGVAGDEEQVTLFLPGKTAGSIRCYRNSSLVQINGTSVRLSAPVLFTENDYLLPISLFEGYLHGFLIEFDKKELQCKITVPNDPVFSLKLQKPETMPEPDPSTLPTTPTVSDDTSETE